MKRRLKGIFVDKTGNMALIAVILVLALLMLFTATVEYLRIQMTVGSIRDALQSSIISITTENYDEVYNGIRQGYSGGYQLDSVRKRWETYVDNGSVASELSKRLGLVNGKKYAGSTIEYELSNLKVDIINVPLGMESNRETFEAQCSVKVKIPFSFGWEHLPPMNFTIKVNATYMPKF